MKEIYLYRLFLHRNFPLLETISLMLLRLGVHNAFSALLSVWATEMLILNQVSQHQERITLPPLFPRVSFFSFSPVWIRPAEISNLPRGAPGKIHQRQNKPIKRSFCNHAFPTAGSVPTGTSDDPRPTPEASDTTTTNSANTTDTANTAP